MLYICLNKSTTHFCKQICHLKVNWASLWENRLFAYAKTKTQISFAVTANLISAFVFATRIVQSLYFLYTKFQTSRHLRWLYSLVCVGPGRKPWRRVFSQRGSICVGENIPLWLLLRQNWWSVVMQWQLTQTFIVNVCGTLYAIILYRNICHNWQKAKEKWI